MNILSILDELRRKQHPAEPIPATAGVAPKTQPSHTMTMLDEMKDANCKKAQRSRAFNGVSVWTIE